jgi:hypothetical protein
MDIYSAQSLRVRRCKGLIRSYLKKAHKRISPKMITAFLNPPNEPPLPREVVVGLFHQTLLEVRNPVPERVTILKKLLGIE